MMGTVRASSRSSARISNSPASRPSSNGIFTSINTKSNAPRCPEASNMSTASRPFAARRALGRPPSRATAPRRSSSVQMRCLRQAARACPQATGRPVSRRGLLVPQSLLVGRRQLQHEEELRTLADAALHVQPSAHRVGRGRAADRQAETRPLRVAAMLGRLLERHEDALEILLADARAGIFHAEAHARASLVAHEHDHAQPDAPIPGSVKLERVGQEIRQHLLQPHVVAHHDVVGIAAGLEPDSLVLGLEKEHALQTLGQRTQAERRRLYAHLVVLDLRHIEDVVHERQQELGRHVDLLERLERMDGVASPDSDATLESPMMAFIGVRISWDMRERKSVFARPISSTFSTLHSPSCGCAPSPPTPR